MGVRFSVWEGVGYLKGIRVGGLFMVCCILRFSLGGDWDGDGDGGMRWMYRDVLMSVFVYRYVQ